jgi:hypothetical protein
VLCHCYNELGDQLCDDDSCNCRCHDVDDFDADELGLDPEEDYDA